MHKPNKKEVPQPTPNQQKQPNNNHVSLTAPRTECWALATAARWPAAAAAPRAAVPACCCLPHADHRGLECDGGEAKQTWEQAAAEAVPHGKQKGGQLQAGMGGSARMLAGQAVGACCILTSTSTCLHSFHTERTPLVPVPLLLATAAAPAAVAAAAAAPVPLPLLSRPLLLLSQLLTADGHGFVGRQQAHTGAVCRGVVLRTEQVGSWAGGCHGHTLRRGSLGVCHLINPQQLPSLLSKRAPHSQLNRHVVLGGSREMQDTAALSTPPPPLLGAQGRLAQHGKQATAQIKAASSTAAWCSRQRGPPDRPSSLGSSATTSHSRPLCRPSTTRMTCRW